MLPNVVLCLYFVMCYTMRFFFLMIVLLNTWIYFQFFLKIDLILWDKLNCNFKYIFINEIGFIKKIVLVVGQINKKIEFYRVGRGFVGPQGAGMGHESFPYYAGWSRDGTRQNHAGWG